jgi:alpha-galactosidase
MIELKQEVLTLRLHPEAGRFSILPNDQSFPAILDASLAVYFKKDGENRHGLDLVWEGCQVSEQSQSGEQGTVRMVRCIVPCHTNGISYEVTFGVAEDYPLALWKVKVLNQSSSPINIDRIELLNTTSTGSSVKFAKTRRAAELGFYYNGWQSWSPAGWVAGDGSMPKTYLGGLQAPMIYNDGTPRAVKRGLFSSDFFAAVGDRTARKGFVLGFLAQKQHFGSIEADFRSAEALRMWANGDNARVDPGVSMETDWAVFNPILLDHREPLEKYLEAVARENHVRVPAESPVGWCSWYHFYTNLSAQDVRDNLKTIVEQQQTLPVQLVQIDDGFETQVGDWFSFKPEFPGGVKPLADEIKAEGLLPGLWLAPFIVHPKSQLFKDHPDWMLRKANGKLVNAGFVWNALDTGLDLTIPEALDYACSVVRTAAKDWGYPYLKLDFLYAAALPGVYRDGTKTRAQVLRMGMEAIRAVVGPDVTLLGCGAPFGSMLGLVEAMRIGPDVSGEWKPTFANIGAFFKNEPSMPCAVNSIRDILTRAALHGHWWVNDPDCLLIRPNTHLSLAEVQTLATAIAMTGGSLLLSDDLPKLPAERLRIAEVLLPVIGERARVLDWFDAEMPAKLRLDQLNDTGEWHLLAKFNWSEKPADLVIDPAEFDLPAGEYRCMEFWSSKVDRIGKGGKFTLPSVPAHGCALVALRLAAKEQPVYLGSDLHFSMGHEVAEWKVTDAKVSFTIRLPRKTEGKVCVSIPWQKFTVELDGAPCEKFIRKGSLIEISVKVDGFTKVVITKR